MSPEDFLGAWQLISWRIVYSDGRVTHPYGERPTGWLLYTAQAMSATVSADPRPTLGNANPRRASDDELAGAFHSYFHYAGPWRVEGNEVVHQITTALNPAMLDTHQRRRASFGADGSLTLSASEALDDQRSREHQLHWQRPTVDTRHAR